MWALSSGPYFSYCSLVLYWEFKVGKLGNSDYWDKEM